MVTHAVEASESAVHTTYSAASFGSCNFKNLSAGPGAPKCGCQSFWLNTSVQNIRQPGEVWCYCGHHACFHDALSAAKQPTSSSSQPSTSPEKSVDPPPDSRNVKTQACHNHARGSREECLGNQKHSSSKDNTTVQTVEMNGAMQEVKSHTMLGVQGCHSGYRDGLPFPPPRSTRSCDQIDLNRSRYLYPAQSNVRAIPALKMPFITGITPRPEDFIGSATEVNTPSVFETPTGRYSDLATGKWVRQDESCNAAAMGTLQNLPDRLLRLSAQEKSRLNPLAPKSDEHFRDMIPHAEYALEQGTEDKSRTVSADQDRQNPLLDWRNVLNSCTRRLDVLESHSFSHLPVEEIQDKFELFEARLLDLESWRQEIGSPDTHESDNSLLCNDYYQSAVDNDSYTSHNAKGLVAPSNSHHFTSGANIDLRCDVERRLGLLEAAFPSYANPWELEVVVLPWGRELKGVWRESSNPPFTHSKTHSQTSADWNGVDSPLEHTVEMSHPGGLSAVESIEHWMEPANPRLSPKAHGPKSVVYKRLHSRGLVRAVTITSCGAYEIWKSIEEAFSHFPASQRTPSNFRHRRQHGALSQPFIPLRKIHKSSQLQFPRPHEMIAPATWNISFLDSGVIMKANKGLKRLYITTPDACVQSEVTGWTWQRLEGLQNLKELSAHSDTSPMPFEEKNGTDGENSCWSHHPETDSPPSSDTAPLSPFTLDIPDPSTQERASSRALPRSPPYTSTNNKRNQNTSDNGHKSRKRRRVSVSLTSKKDNINITPRWSYEPPSLPRVNTRQVDDASTRKKRLTPFAYATPHSDPVTRLYLDASDGGDTERESDVSDPDGEDEWRGVEEDDSRYDSSSSAARPSSDLGSATCEDDGDDGPMITAIYKQ